MVSSAVDRLPASQVGGEGEGGRGGGGEEGRRGGGEEGRRYIGRGEGERERGREGDKPE